MGKILFVILGILALLAVVGVGVVEGLGSTEAWIDLACLLCMMVPLAIIFLAVGAHLIGDRKMTAEERARIVAEIRGRREAGLPRPRPPRKSLLLPAAVAGVVGIFLVMGLFAIGRTPLWFVFLPVVATAAFLPFAVFMGSDRRPSAHSRGLVRRRSLNPWEDTGPVQGGQVWRFAASSLDSGPLQPPPRHHGGAGPSRTDSGRK